MANNTELFEFSLSILQFTDERTFLLKVSLFWKITIWICVTGSLLVGWIAKLVIYLHIFKKNINEQPINVLILIEQLVHLFCGNLVLLSTSLSLPMGLSIAEMIEKYFGDVISGNTYCWFYFYTQSLSITYRGVNGLGIAVIRFLYIKRGTWVKYNIGEWTLIFWVGIKISSVSCLIIYLYGMENVSNRSLYNTCMGHSQTFEVINFFKCRSL